MERRVIHKLSEEKAYCLVVLFKVAENPNIMLKGLVLPLSLTVCLGIEGSA